MTKDIKKALENVEMTYDNLSSIADEITKDIVKSVDELIPTDIDNSIELSLDYVRMLMFKLSVASYSLSEIKDKASLKQECAETLYKEKYATSFNSSVGTVAYKENNALLQSSEETLTELVYGLVESTLKTKLDEVHRIVDVLKTIVMSKMQEMKVNQTLSVGDVGETYNRE